MSSEVLFAEIPNGGDVRGILFRVAPEMIRALGAVGDIHFGQLNPGALRGNHVHGGNSELLIIQWHDSCELAWDAGEGTAPSIRQFSGTGAAALFVPPGCAHAIRNTGSKVMEFVSLPSFSYDITDVTRRELLK